MSAQHDRILRNERSAYRHWQATTFVIDLFNKKINRRRNDKIGGRSEIQRLTHLRDIAVLEEQDAYERWVKACNVVDETQQAEGH